jgi:hypothetical protein
MLAPAAPLAAAQGPRVENGARASVDVRIVIPVVLRAEQLREPETLSIAQADIARGYLDVEEGASLLLTSNNRAGFDVSVAFDPAVVSRVAAHLAGPSVESDGEGPTLHVDAPKLVREPVRVRYRIHLAPGARAGTYAWPLRLGVTPAA